MTEHEPTPVPAASGQTGDRGPWRAALKPAEEHPAVPDVENPAGRARVWPRVFGVLLFLIGVGGVWLWLNPGIAARLLGVSPDSGPQIASLSARLTRIEQRPDPVTLAARINALEQEVKALQTAASAVEPRAGEVAALAARLNALEARPAPAAGPADGTASPSGLAPLAARLDALDRRVDAIAVEPKFSAEPKGEASGEAAGAPAGDTKRIDALANRMDGFANRDAVASLRSQVDELERRLERVAARDVATTGAADRAITVARLQAAAAELTAGRPLGVIQGAPPALARFASTPPPTEAALRLAFPAAAREALRLSVPDTNGKSFWERVLARLQAARLVTVREGDRMLIGEPTLESLEHARALLDVGDLSGAVRAVGSIAGPPAEALGAWLADARALLEAREALAQGLARAAGPG